MEIACPTYYKHTHTGQVDVGRPSDAEHVLREVAAVAVDCIADVHSPYDGTIGSIYGEVVSVLDSHKHHIPHYIAYGFGFTVRAWERKAFHIQGLRDPRPAERQAPS